MKIMTPGPTMVSEEVRKARALPCTNPDLDMEFFKEYKTLCDEIAQLLHTTSNVYLLSGEGILGLEAAVASLCEKDDRILVISNGIFGRGFKDFVEIYGGKAIVYEADPKRGIDVSKLEAYLKEDHDFKFATVVHCDTPSGVLNPIQDICPLLKRYGIMSVVDSVSAMFAVEVFQDAWDIDILLGGSQKAMSVPPGLTIASVSDAAIQSMQKRSTPIASFYCNLLNFLDYDKKQSFPYTMPISDIYGLKASIDEIRHDNKRYERHQMIANACRKALCAYGLTMYLEDDYSPSLSVFEVPQGIQSDMILKTMIEDHRIMIAGCFDVLKDKVLRIGHMGYNANVNDVRMTLRALDETLRKLNFKGSCDMEAEFMKHIA